MLVYANHLSFEGRGAGAAVFKGIGAWLKEQLGFGLHPDQLRKDGEFTGTRDAVRSWLRVVGTAEQEPNLHSWVLRFSDDNVRGRQWISEVGVKISGEKLDMSCVVKTDENSTLVASPVSASQPRLIRYVVRNIQLAKDVDLTAAVPGVAVRSVGEDRDSYRALLAEIERRDREGPLILVSPTRDGDYLIDPADLQQKLVGLAQVVQVVQQFNSYEMSEVLGQQNSAWGGAVNVLSMPSLTGHVHGRYFLSDAISDWGENQNQRVSQVLAIVTGATNIPRLRKHIRPEGVMQLSLRRRMQAASSRSLKMSAAQLRAELEAAATQSVEQEKYFDELAEENSQLAGRVSESQGQLEEAQDELAKKEFTIQSLKDQLGRAGGGHNSCVQPAELVEVACRAELTPLNCLDLVERAYGEECIILPTAKTSAEKVQGFLYGRELMKLMRRLATDYRSKLIEGGDNKARAVFGKSEYAAKESETVMNNKAMRRQRTFPYEGEDVEMFRHLKIGVDEDETKTIRVHFHWDADRRKIVIGYCGSHRPVSSH